MSGLLPPGPLPTGSKGPALNAVQIVMIVIPMSAVVLRFMSRRMSAAGLWWDDWMCLIALILSLAINVLNLAAVNLLGLGKHIWNIPDFGHNYLKSLFTLEILYTTALAANKLAVLLMYERLFGIERKFSIAVKVVAGIVIAWWIGVEVTTLLQCKPVEKFWSYTLMGKCFDIVQFFAASAIPNVITDVIILLLPQPLVWRLKMSWPNKLALCGVFLLGAFTAISSIGRLVSIIEFKQDIDFTYNAFLPVIWYSLEPAIGIICACLPCFGPLLRKLPGSPLSSQNALYDASRPDLPRGRAGLFSNPRIRHVGLGIVNTEILTHTDSSSKTLVHASAAHRSVDDTCGSIERGSFELNAMHVRDCTHVTTPTRP